MPDVVEQPVGAAGPFAEPGHLLLDDPRDRGVEGVDRLPRLEEDVGILRAAAEHRSVGRERSGPVRAHELLVQERRDVVFGQALHRAQLVRRPEAVEEVEEGDACA